MYRINPDSKPALLTIAAGTALVFLASFALSFNALVDVSSWGDVPHRLAWAVPVMLDVAVVLYSLSALVRRSRGQSAWFSWSLLGFFTIVSLLGNAAHSLGVPEVAQPIVGTVVVALAPVAALAALENLASLIVASPIARTLRLSSGESSVVVRELEPSEADELDLLSTLASTHAQSKRIRENLAAILDLKRTGVRYRDIAQAVGMSETLVKSVVRDMQSVGLVARN